MPTMVRKLA